MFQGMKLFDGAFGIYILTILNLKVQLGKMYKLSEFQRVQSVLLL